MSVVTPGPSRPSASIVDLIGNTPLIRLTSFEAGLRNVELYAKAEWKNPGGSVKDRPAARMIADGERSGTLTRDKIILDATSGNTGIAYAMIGAARGFRVRLCVPENVTPERKKVLRAFGAEVVFTNPMEGSDGAIIKARAMYAANPELYFYPDQYNNESNWRSHFDTTGPEIIEQTGGRLTHFVAGLGTSGTFVGVGRRLRQFKPSIELISVQPDSPLHGLEGLKHMDYGDRARHLRSRAGRRGHPGEHGRGVRAHAAAGAAGRAARRASRAAPTSRARCASPARRRTP